MVLVLHVIVIIFPGGFNWDKIRTLFWLV